MHKQTQQTDVWADKHLIYYRTFACATVQKSIKKFLLQRKLLFQVTQIARHTKGTGKKTVSTNHNNFCPRKRTLNSLPLHSKWHIFYQRPSLIIKNGPNHLIFSLPRFPDDVSYLYYGLSSALVRYSVVGRLRTNLRLLHFLFITKTAPAVLNNPMDRVCKARCYKL